MNFFFHQLFLLVLLVQQGLAFTYWDSFKGFLKGEVSKQKQRERQILVPETTRPPYDRSALDIDDEYATTDGKTFLLIPTSPWKRFRQAVSKTPSHPNLREGDMMFQSEERKAIPGVGCTQTWPKAIKYLFDASVTAEMKANVIKAFEVWQNATCLTFTEVTTDPGTDHFYVTMAETGCWADLGMICTRQQNKIVLGGGHCNHLAVIIHEIGHGLGLYHEHSRSDRDDYIRINMDNVEPWAKDNFKVQNDTNNYGLMYDYNSIMHYARDLFSIDSPAKATIETIDPLQQFRIGNAESLSHYDKAIVNLMYTCDDGCVSKPTCLNGGYVDKNCDCICPPNYSGADCATKDGPDYPPVDNECGDQVVNTSGTVIKSFNYPDAHPDIIKCVWHLRPESGKKAKITFDAASLHEDTWIEYILVLEDGFSGEKSYAGNELDGKSFESKSKIGEMVIVWRSGYMGATTGFTATVNMIEDDGKPPVIKPPVKPPVKKPPVRRPPVKKPPVNRPPNKKGGPKKKKNKRRKSSKKKPKKKKASKKKRRPKRRGV